MITNCSQNSRLAIVKPEYEGGIASLYYFLFPGFPSG